jgi:hypothetical protein
MCVPASFSYSNISFVSDLMKAQCILASRVMYLLQWLHSSIIVNEEHLAYDFAS